jgi:hypothetical protein
MELPIQLKFFKKLELYQEFKYQNKKSTKASKNLQKVWKTEKLILKWTVWHHHLLAHPVNYEYFKKELIPKDKESDYSLSGAFTNFIRKKYAEENESKSGILFTKEGLLMGEVTDDMESKNVWKRLKYGIFFWFVWATAIAGGLTVIVNFFKLLLSF